MRNLYPFLLLYRRYWLRITLGISLAIITLLASIGLLTLSGWFLAGTAIAGFVGGYFNYMLPAAGVRGSAIIRTAGRYAERLVSHDTTFRVLAQLRVFTFSKLLPLTPAAIVKFKRAELLNRLVADVDTLDHLYLRLLSPIVSALTVIILVTFGLSFIDTHLALTLGAILAVLVVITPLMFYTAGKPIGVQLTRLRGQYRYQLAAWIQGQAELSIFGALNKFRQRLDQTERQWLQQQNRQASLTGLSIAFVTLTSGLTSVLILWLAAAGVNGNTTPGPLIALFVFASLAAFEAIAPIAGAFLHLGQVMTSAARVNELLSQKAEVSFPLEQQSIPTQADIVLDNLTFSYPGQPLPVLNHISLTVPAKSNIAILGKTGCGKSTLLQLLTRAWDPQCGTISMGQRDIKHYDEESLRRTIAVVSQRVHIFSATLRHNLTIADESADDNRLIQVLTDVGLQHLLNENGLDIWLGEGGRPLSGGEQRRIGIARALLHQAPIILLDEPTEGLDAETERHILTLLAEHSHGKTLVMVTHRLTALAHVDTIVVMDGGQIIEYGDHSTLIAQRGLYYQFMQE
jgi:ATP-binding cassette subfamily C protein CydC